MTRVHVSGEQHNLQMDKYLPQVCDTNEGGGRGLSQSALTKQRALTKLKSKLV